MKFDTDYCEVCNEPLYGEGMKRGDLPSGVNPDDIYRPGDDAFEPYTEEDAIEDELRRRQMKSEAED